MSVMAQVRFNYEDYCLLPEGKRYEIIDGGLQMTPAPTTRHQEISRNIEYQLIVQLQVKGLGVVLDAPVDVFLSDEDIVQPDIVAVDVHRQRMIEEKYIRGAPDLIVEILSSSNTDWDRVVKKKLYHKYGVKEYWIVDPEARSIEVFVWDNPGYRLVGSFTMGTVNSTVFPSLAVNHSDVFAK